MQMNTGNEMVSISYVGTFQEAPHAHTPTEKSIANHELRIRR